MRRFDFPLQRVADWREKQLAVEEIKLERLNAALTILDARRVALNNQQAACERVVLEASTVSAEELHRLDDFKRYAKNQRVAIAGLRAQAEAEISKQRTALLEARRNLELLKRLRSKRLAAWQREFDLELEQQAAESHLSRIHTVIDDGPRFAQA